MAISGKNGDDDDDDGGGGDNAIERAPHAAVLWWRTWRRPPRSGGGGGLETMGERSRHQPIIISRQPGVPPKQKLIWKMAPVAINIDRPPPHCVGGRSSICQLL